MKRLLLTFTTVFFVIGSVMAQQQKENKKVVQLSDPVEETDTSRTFGDAFDADVNVTPLTDLVNTSDKYDNTVVATEGTIKQVCQKKGCFFMLESNNSPVDARVSFKDYSFFVPTDVAGKKVRLKGTFNVKTISEDDAKHYAEDAGEDPDAIIGPQKEYSLTATSVMIYK